MKWLRTQQTASAGVLFVESVVNAHGSIYRPIHQETDVGIDGYIELVNAEEASGRLIAVQIKSGDSYLSQKGDQFNVAVSPQHINYWESYVLPVILICYSPSRDIAAWVSIHKYIEWARYHNQLPISQIRIPLYEHTQFNQNAISEELSKLAKENSDQKFLLKCIDKCLSQNLQERRDGFSILQAHPASRDLKITIFLARQLLMDSDVQIAKNALFVLGYGVGRERWSWNPSDAEENEIIAYACDLCSTLSEEEIRQAIALVDGEVFRGSEALGERCFDVLGCCAVRSDRILKDIVSDTTQSLERRSNALFMLYECDDDYLDESSEYLQYHPDFGEVFRWMYLDQIDCPEPDA